MNATTFCVLDTGCAFTFQRAKEDRRESDVGDAFHSLVNTRSIPQPPFPIATASPSLRTLSVHQGPGFVSKVLGVFSQPAFILSLFVVLLGVFVHSAYKSHGSGALKALTVVLLVLVLLDIVLGEYIISLIAAVV